MSETPRTNEESAPYFRYPLFADSTSEVVSADFARTLERELMELEKTLAECRSLLKHYADDNIALVDKCLRIATEK